MAKIAAARQSQLVSTYGIGSLFPAQNQSFMIMGLHEWTDSAPEIQEPRLARALGVHMFKAPAAGSKNGKDVPVIRFPEWHVCPQCRKLAPIREHCSWDKHECGNCDQDLVPSRFVVCCPQGHIDDFPYSRWLHGGAVPEGQHELTLTARGRSSSLGDIVIECSCGTRPVSMEGAFDADALRNIAWCKGRRPWLGKDSREKCSEVPRTLQRGSSNVWFPVTASALSIPPWSEGAYRLLDKNWRALEAVPIDALPATIKAMNIATGGYSVDQLIQAALARRQQAELPTSDSVDDLRVEEYRALCAGKAESEKRQDFVCTFEKVPESLNDPLEQVGRVARLREVRALTGFTRIMPRTSTDKKQVVAALAPGDCSWRPAIEVIGEGIWLRFDLARIQAWEVLDFAQGRAKRVQDSIDKKALDKGLPSEVRASPRVLLLHSFAHALIDQLSLDAGYPAASLRERLYTDDDMAGVLVYTATSDSAGSLGGLAAMSTPDRLGAAVHTAVERMGWCSSDPVCIEVGVSGADGLNVAACHSCLLLPETSCERNNTFLDRATLVGTPSEPGAGFFADL